MFTRGQLNLLFRAVIYKIDCPKTFYNISLVCKDFAKLCHEYAPMKKKEFSVERNFYYYGIPSKGMFLPNGNRHETGLYDNGIACVPKKNYLNYGDLGAYIESLYYKGGNKFEERVNKLIGNKYFWTCIVGNVENTDFKTLDISYSTEDISENRLTLTKCILCGGWHDIQYSQNEGKIYRYMFDCLKRKMYKIDFDTFSYNSDDFVHDEAKRIKNFYSIVESIYKRNKIIKSVIRYAKDFQKEYRNIL